MESGSYGEGYRDARKHAGQEAQILVRNATAEFRKQVDLLVEDNRKLRQALQEIANGEGAYGAQAFEYKQIARAALGEEK